MRFDTKALRAAIERCDADIFVAEHAYMAESFLESAHAGNRRLVVNTHVSEALVWRATRGALGLIEAPRLRRDELRVARAADAVGALDADEAEYYRSRGVANARWLDLTMPPGEQVDLSASSPRLVFLGTRSWPPNQEAFERALDLWPRIAEGIADAELVVVGPKAGGAKDVAYPHGVRDLGFVEDLDGLLSTCRAMMAPILTGGGVRVKLLEAASVGLPFIGSSLAVGSLGSVFAMQTFDGDGAFIAECRRLLKDRAAAVAAGNHLYESNRDHWLAHRPLMALESLIRPPAT
ncbi:glycosyltransferase family 4 protein [Mycobacterium sp. NPDC006124]|uniref:glycosyltransferase n=1 Tax=Mycobacterium sp. NPDC006124 TaxID=3156729 RepID=UPI0033BD300C